MFLAGTLFILCRACRWHCPTLYMYRYSGVASQTKTRLTPSGHLVSRDPWMSIVVLHWRRVSSFLSFIIIISSRTCSIFMFTSPTICDQCKSSSNAAFDQCYISPYLCNPPPPPFRRRRGILLCTCRSVGGRSVGWSVGRSVSLNLVQQINREHFALETSNLVGR